MDAVEFVKAYHRMCDKFSSCEECVAYGACCDDKHPERWVEAVEKWAAENPEKTRQSVFLEHYPNAPIDMHGVLRACPRHIEGYDFCGLMCGDKSIDCTDCRREYWTKEAK